MIFHETLASSCLITQDSWTIPSSCYHIDEYTWSELSFSIFKKLDFHQFFVMDKSMAKSQETYFACQAVEFICRGIHANFTIIVSYYLKSSLSSGANHLCRLLISGLEVNKQTIGILDLGCSIMRPFINPPVEVRTFCDINLFLLLSLNCLKAQSNVLCTFFKLTL